MPESPESLFQKIRESDDSGIRKVGQLFCNLGFIPKVVDKNFEDGGTRVGNIDLVFEYLRHHFVIEVSEQRHDRNEKIAAWYQKWTTERYASLVGVESGIHPAQRQFRVYVDLSRNSDGEGVDLIPRTLRQADLHNSVLFRDDIRYFEFEYSKVKDFARYDLLSYLGAKPTRESTPIDNAIQFYMDDVYAISFVMCADTLLKAAYVYRRRGGTRGYQRFLNYDRIVDIEKKIRQKKILSFPNSVLINIERENVLVEPRKSVADCPSSCHVEFPTEYCSSRIIDGQHRLMGIARLEPEMRESIHLQVIAFLHLDDAREVETFLQINNNQNKVDRNLVFDLIGDREWPPDSKFGHQKVAVLAARELHKRHVVQIFFGAADEERKGKIALATLVTTLLTTSLIGGRNNFWQGKEYEELKELFGKIKNPDTGFSTAWKTFMISNRGVRILLRLVYVLERNRQASTTSMTNGELLEHLRNIADVALLARVTSYFGHGGADLAVRDIFDLMKARFPEQFAGVTRDFRSLAQASSSLS